MKKLIALFTLVAALTIPAAAQTTNTPPQNIAGLGETVLDYLTSFNPALETTFHDNRFVIWTGVDSIRGGAFPLVNEFGGSYDFWQPSHSPTNTSTGVFIEALERNGGALNTVSSGQAGLGFAMIVHDVRLSLSADAGYNLDTNNDRNLKRMYGEVDFRAMKALGTHFAAGVGMFVQFPGNAQGLFAIASATF